MLTRSSTRAFAPTCSARSPAVRVLAVLRTAPKPVGKNASSAPTSSRRRGLQLGFTKENELFVGRAAMLGFALSLIGELLTGKGALAQLGYEIFDDKVNMLQVDELVVGLILFNLVAAVLPASGTFVPDEEVAQRPKGALQDPRVSLANPARFFGISGSFGFTKENELFVGRVAQLGFAASLIGETLTGKGALAQFDIETGLPLQDTEFGLAAFILFFLFAAELLLLLLPLLAQWCAAINPGTGRFVKEDLED
ncbi:hypothetical protein QJQ45_004915 [Haematococcus lacustris]|nr:hypothetical protein QJQ45_004915 [Haematococcus lacustris]